jgi:hypothetical protein
MTRNSGDSIRKYPRFYNTLHYLSSPGDSADQIGPPPKTPGGKSTSVRPAPTSENQGFLEYITYGIFGHELDR